MLRKVFLLTLVSVSMVIVTPTVSANSPVCPYDLSGSGMTDEQIMAFCGSWERERQTPRERSTFNHDGKRRKDGTVISTGVTRSYPLPSDRIPKEVD